MFGSVKSTVNDDLDKYGYNGYGIGFDERPHLSSADGNCGKNNVICWVDNSSSMHDDTKK